MVTQMPSMNMSSHHHMPGSTGHPHMHPTTMGHSGHGGSHGAAHGDGAMHTMFFDTAYEGLTVLFKPFELKNEKGLVVACVVLFVVAVLYEGLKVMRELLLQRSIRQRCSNAYRSTSDSKRSQKCCLSCAHLLQSFLHLVQVTVSYLLMLAVMTFNVWLGLSVVLGAGVGYLLFAWKRSSVGDINEHCN